MADPEDLYHIQQVLVHAYAGKWVKCTPAEAAGSLRQLLAAGDLEEYIPHDDFVALQDAATALEESAGLAGEPNGAQQGAAPPSAPADAAAPNGTANGMAAGEEPRADSAEADGVQERPKKSKEKRKKREEAAADGAAPAKGTKRKSKGTGDQ